MKKHEKLFLFLFLITLSCSKGYICDGVFVPGFDTKGVYTIAVLTPYIQGGSEQLADRLHNHLIMRLTRTKHLIPIEKSRVRQVEAGRAVGGEKPSPAEAISIARELGAQLVCITEIGVSSVPEDKGMPLYCSLSIVDVNTGTEIYRGSGRTANPVSVEAGGEWVIDLATKVLVKGMK